MNTTEAQTLTLTPLNSNLLLSPVAIDVLLTLFLLVFSEFIGLFGILANVVNICVFYKQGYEDCVNITLTALAVSDLGVLVTGQVFNLLANSWFLKADMPIVQIEVVYMIIFYPRNYFTRVCGFITAFASFERCLCVMVPLHVKRIVTKKVAVTVILIFYLVTLLDLVPLYYVAYLDWSFRPEFNTSKFGLVYRENPYNVFSVSYFVSDLFAPYFTFSIVISCTCIIAVKLKTRALWRSSMSTSERFSNKETKVVAMLMVVSVIFIVCLIPQSAILTTVSFFPELSIKGVYVYFTLLCLSLANVMETVNSSVSIIVYYKMSSNYREKLNCLFRFIDKV
ncbi:uncharacterized protein LOC131933794 [Physella acuta]|uniref:uncharacterized protein LOC131933794 n=1 Tax=Physella acuta TaxID=109671 RepID=UPI0027DAD799|nr:uncharacterized protein LOC131933794 [Physella acuta]